MFFLEKTVLKPLEKSNMQSLENTIFSHLYCILQQRRNPSRSVKKYQNFKRSQYISQKICNHYIGFVGSMWNLHAYFGFYLFLI